MKIKGGGIIHKALWHAKSTLAGIIIFPTKIENHVGMAERLARDSDIEDALQI